MKIDQKMDEISAWFESDEGKASFKKLITEMEEEDILAAELESKSTLTYRDGQKVCRWDVFVEEYEEKYEQPFGRTNLVYRINEDGTIDNCLSRCFAWKANNYRFNPAISTLVRRDGKVQNPLYDEIIVE